MTERETIERLIEETRKFMAEASKFRAERWLGVVIIVAGALFWLPSFVILFRMCSR